MSLRYCFEEDHVKSTLSRSKPSDLAVIDSDGISKAVIQQAVNLADALNTLTTSIGVINYAILYYRNSTV